MASYHHVDHETLPGPDSDGHPTDRTNACTDSNQEMEKGPFILSGCRLGHSIVPECEFFEEGNGSLETKFNDCVKNPGHKNFIHVKELTEDHLPEHLRSEVTMEEIKGRIDRTVLIRVAYTSIDRPDTFYDSKAPYPYSKFKGKAKLVRTGTGSIVGSIPSEPVIGDCPCHECKKTGNHQKRYWKYNVNTATHVIYDSSEAERAVVKCFFDSDEDEDQNEVVKLYGVNLISTISQEEMFKSDCSGRLVCVTHDKQSSIKIRMRVNHFMLHTIFTKPQHGIIISHPHGCPKMISMGYLLHRTIPIKPVYEIGRREKLPPNTTYHLPSDSTTGGDVSLQPQPTNPLRKLISTFRSFFRTRDIHIREGSTFTLPADAGYAMRYTDKCSFAFPPGTTFHSVEGATVTIPDNAIFKSEGFKIDLHLMYSVSYNIPTCPGSSGAEVPHHWEGVFGRHTYIPHAGCDGLEKCNRSAIDYYASKMAKTNEKD